SAALLIEVDQEPSDAPQQRQQDEQQTGGKCQTALVRTPEERLTHLVPDEEHHGTADENGTDQCGHKLAHCSPPCVFSAAGARPRSRLRLAMIRSRPRESVVRPARPDEA